LRNVAAWCGVWVVTLGMTTAAWSGETTYRKHVKPLFENRCATCHGAKSARELGDFKEKKEDWIKKGQGMRMDTYSHLLFYVAWPDTGAFMRRLDDGKSTKDGKPGNMYTHLGKTDDERAKNLKLLKDWVGLWTLQRRKDITKKDLEAIQAKY